MSNSQFDIKPKIEALNDRVQDFTEFYSKSFDYNQMIYEFWSAKDILGHITFWHESFARNLKDLAEGIKPNPLKGKLSEVNLMSVETTSKIPIDKLINRLLTAQKLIDKNIKNTAIEIIPYKKGSRSYTRYEHLVIVERHIGKHLKDLIKKTKFDKKKQNEKKQ